MEDVSLDNGVLVQVENVPRDITSQVELFFVCSTCGKVFWEGKHFGSVCTQFADVLCDVSKMAVYSDDDLELEKVVRDRLTLK